MNCGNSIRVVITRQDADEVNVTMTRLIVAESNGTHKIECDELAWESAIEPVHQRSRCLSNGLRQMHLAARLSWHVVRPGLAAQNNAHKVGCVTRAEFFHDAGAVDFYSTWGNAQLLAGFLVGLAVGDQLENFAFTRG